jgi:hypothetical protein
MRTQKIGKDAVFALMKTLSQIYLGDVRNLLNNLMGHNRSNGRNSTQKYLEENSAPPEPNYFIGHMLLLVCTPDRRVTFVSATGISQRRGLL